jgi:hypothetical protein
MKVVEFRALTNHIVILSDSDGKYKNKILTLTYFTKLFFNKNKNIKVSWYVETKKSDDFGSSDFQI